MPTLLKNDLDALVYRFNTPAFFIENDPISIPHRYSKLPDIEITAFWVAMLSWGQRKTIINKSNELFALMDNAPHDFILHHTEREREAFLRFKHRTFQADDTLGFLSFLQRHYQQHKSLETAFAQHLTATDTTIEAALIGFHNYFFDNNDALPRTRKHISTPARGSACKRLCMFLRWMVRHDGCGVDFGLWRSISPAQLVVPLDVHVERQARRLGLLHREKTDWRAALELTANLRQLDPHDPAKYDFALFGLGILEQTENRLLVSNTN